MVISDFNVCLSANYEIGKCAAVELKPLHKLLYGREGRVCRPHKSQLQRTIHHWTSRDDQTDKIDKSDVP